MFGIMGNVMTLVKKSKEPTRKLTLAMLGLDNAGKTLTAKGLLGEEATNTEPTVGFDTMSFKIGRHDITLYDLGGGPRIRDIWDNYYHELYGVVFVVDSSSVDRMNECKAALVRLLAHDRVKGKPMLLLANKQDVPGCLDENELREQLDLEHLVNEHCVPCFLVTCSAMASTGKRMDGAIRAGLHWLLEAIEQDFEALHKRVVADIESRRQQEKEEKAKRMERVRLAREQREKQEQEERERNGEAEPPAAEADEANVDGPTVNPFQPLDKSKLEAKENELKKKKKQKQEQQKQEQQKHASSLPAAAPLPSPAASPSSPSLGSAAEQSRVDGGVQEASPAHSGSKSLDSTGRASTRSEPDAGAGGGAVPLGLLSQHRVASEAPAGAVVQRPPRPGSPLPTSAASSPKKSANGSAGSPEGADQLLASRRLLPPLGPSSPLGPLRGVADDVEADEIKKPKQRKKKARKSQVSPGGGGSAEAIGQKGSQDTLKRFSIIQDTVPEAPSEVADPSRTTVDDDDDAVVIS